MKTYIYETYTGKIKTASEDEVNKFGGLAKFFSRNTIVWYVEKKLESIKFLIENRDIQRDLLSDKAQKLQAEIDELVESTITKISQFNVRIPAVDAIIFE